SWLRCASVGARSCGRHTRSCAGTRANETCCTATTSTASRSAATRRCPSRPTARISATSSVPCSRRSGRPSRFSREPAAAIGIWTKLCLTRAPGELYTPSYGVSADRSKGVRMRRSGSRKFLWYGSVILAVATVVIAVASAQAAPALKKNFEASVRIENATESHSVFRLTMKNDPASQQTLGSAQFALPAGFALVGTPATNVSTGFSVRYLGGNIAEFDANSSGTALKAGGVATADVAITPPSACLRNDWRNSAFAQA